jgi:hypothetical protein
MAACPLLSKMVAEKACSQILNCHHNDQGNSPVSHWDRDRYPYRGYVVCFSWWCLEEEEEKCAALMS